MSDKKTILRSFLIFSIAILLHFSQYVSATTFDEMLQQFQSEELIENHTNNVVNMKDIKHQILSKTNPIATLSTMHVGVLYSIVNHSEKKTYLYFGKEDDNSQQTDTIHSYEVKIELTGQKAETPIVTKCTLFLKQGKKFLSRTFTPNQSIFKLQPELPKGISLHQSTHLFQCEFNSPKSEYRSIYQTVSVRNAAGYYGRTINTKYWTQAEYDQEKEFTPEEKASFSEGLSLIHDDYNITPQVAKHSLKITNLANDYKDGERINIRLSGVEYKFIKDTKLDEIDCNIQQILKDGVETTFNRKISLGEYTPTSTSNPEFSIPTGVVGKENIQYHAGSNLSIQCPEILLYKSIVPLGPNFHLSSVIRAEKGLVDTPIAVDSIICNNYPCSTFIHHPERRKDTDDEVTINKSYYYIGGGVLGVLILGGIIFTCVRSKKRGEEYMPLIN